MPFGDFTIHLFNGMILLLYTGSVHVADRSDPVVQN